jgi:hypothetical protein
MGMVWAWWRLPDSIAEIALLPFTAIVLLVARLHATGGRSKPFRAGWLWNKMDKKFIYAGVGLCLFAIIWIPLSLLLLPEATPDTHFLVSILPAILAFCTGAGVLVIQFSVWLLFALGVFSKDMR